MQKIVNKRKPGALPPRPQAAHQVRIIGGQWKRSTLPVLAADGLRPTPDRVRETVFNWINHLRNANWAEARCLDLFAGSGALGFEAASRGAATVTLVEAHTPVIVQLEAVKARLKADQVNIVRGDALRCAQDMAARGQQYDLIFLDPPYQQGWLGKILPICERLLAPGGLLYAESDVALGPVGGLASCMHTEQTDDQADDKANDQTDDQTPSTDWLDGWEIVRADQAGMVFYQLLIRKATGK